MNIKRILFGALVAVGIAAGAETADVAPVRPVNSSYMLSVGSSHLGDTYLSAVKYTGWSAAFNYDRMQAMKFSPDRWRQQLQLGVQVDGAENPARNAHMYYASLSASWGMRKHLPFDFATALLGAAVASGRRRGRFGRRKFRRHLLRPQQQQPRFGESRHNAQSLRLRHMALPHRPLAGNASVADVVAADRRIFLAGI